MKRIPALLLLIVVINCYLFLPAQAADKVIQNWPTSVDEMISTAKKSINMINMKEFDAVLESDAYDLIIDVREPYEFDRGHVPGAINIPRGVIEFMIWKKVGFPDKTDLGGKFYIYCRTGSRTALAAATLKDLGFTNIYGIDMKFSNWLRFGYPTEK
jgi:rhodanese-related sulfurtransferase